MAKILLVDDDPTNSDLLKMFLELEAFEVAVAHNLDDARCALAPSIDLVLLDYHLTRKMNGLTLLTEIRDGQTDIPATTPIIVASGDDRVDQKSLDEGANLFMHKPFSPSNLVVKIRDLLTSSN